MGCLLASGGALHGAVINRVYPEQTTKWFFGVGARGTFSLNIAGPLSVRADADLGVTLRRAALDVRQPQIWQTYPVTLNLATSLMLSF
jgi:hypothetical protein